MGAPEDTPVANIQMHRGAPISVALYEMNKVKQQKLKDKKKREQVIIDLTIEQEVQKAHCAESTKYLCQKFEKEYRTVILNMANEE